jgi:hypothetical protein
MFRISSNIIAGAVVGFVLGGLLSGAIGFAVISNGHELPNGNPTEVRFFEMLRGGASAFAAVIYALFGGSVAAVVGAGASLLFSLRGRLRSPQNQSPDSMSTKQSGSFEKSQHDKSI